MSLILHTIITRPYVFVFLLAYLVLSIQTRGLLRTSIFLVTGYIIAWASEWYSINTGFPYGWYFYIYENLQGEWLNAGVPVWDSVSYVFLCFAGLSVAEFVLCPLTTSSFSWKKLVSLTLLAAFLTTLLDMVIDPLAHLGDQWFLGKIYYYPSPGFYFDVPLSNFAGWFLVSFVIVGVNLGIDRMCSLRGKKGGMEAPLPLFWRISGPLLYFGIFLFNWIITLWIRQWALAVIDVVWILIPLVLVWKRDSTSLISGQNS